LFVVLCSLFVVLCFLFRIHLVANILPNYASDLLRWEVLYEYGGFYFDLDQIILKSFDDFENYDIVWGGNKIDYSGVVGMFKHCPIADIMNKKTNEAIKTAVNYCDAGNWLWSEFVNSPAGKEEMKYYQLYKTPQHFFYPIEQSFMMKDFYDCKKSEITDSAIRKAYALHWFGGHPDSQKFNQLTPSQILDILETNHINIPNI